MDGPFVTSYMFGILQHAIDLVNLVEKVRQEKVFHDGMFGLFNRVMKGTLFCNLSASACM
jgi:hypothetical protein